MSEQRREVLVSLVREAGRVGLADLADATGVSEMTVRRDLDELTERGLLRRVRGGAVSLDVAGEVQQDSGSPPGHTRQGEPTPPSLGRPAAAAAGRLASASNSPARPASSTSFTLSSPLSPGSRGPAAAGRGATGLERAGRAVAEQVPPGGTVLLDAGPGAVEVATHLAHRSPLTVAVTSLQAAAVLAGAPGIRLIVLGGEPRPGEPGLLGPTALAALADLHLDLFVLTPAGLDPGTGCWARSPDAAALARAAVSRSDRTVVVADADVLGRRSLVHVAALSALAEVVTATEEDLGAVPVLRALREAGASLLQV